MAQHGDATRPYIGQCGGEAGLDGLQRVLLLSAREVLEAIATARHAGNARHLTGGSVHCVAALEEATVALAEASESGILRIGGGDRLAEVLCAGCKSHCGSEFYAPQRGGDNAARAARA